MIYIENLVNELLENMFYFNDVFIKHIITTGKHNEKLKEVYNKIGQRQWDILFILTNTNLNTTSAIGKELCLSKSSISLTVSKMVNTNIIEKSYSDNEDDSRIVVLKITNKGKKLYNDFFALLINFMKKNIQALTEKEIALINEGLQQVCIFSNLLNISELKIESIDSADLNKFILGIFYFKTKVELYANELKKNINSNLSSIDISILELIYKYKINTPKEISDIVLKSESSVSFQLSNMVKKKYLVREKKGDDVRKTFFSLTEQGINEYTRVNNSILEFIRENLKNFNYEIISTMNQSILCFISFFNLLNQKERGYN